MILSILKIIGIVLLCIVGLILIIAILFLACPFKYKIIINSSDDDIDIITDVKWLFGFIHFSFKYVENELEYFLKIIGINLDIDSKPEEEKNDVKSSDEFKIDSVESHNRKNAAKHIQNDLKVKVKKKKKEKGNVTKKKLTLKELFVNWLNKLKILLEKIRAAINFLNNDITKRAIKKLKLIVVKLIKHVFPKKIYGKLTFGFEQPSTTALVYGLFAGWAEQTQNNKLLITPIFEEKYFLADLKIYGRLFAGFVLLYLLQLVLNKDFKKVVKAIRRKI